MSVYADRKNNCCAVCRWGAARTNSSNEPFDEAFILRKISKLQVDDVVKTMRPTESGSCVLGLVIATEKLPGNRRQAVSVAWDDRPDPVSYISKGASGMMTLVRDDETIVRYDRKRIVKWNSAAPSWADLA